MSFKALICTVYHMQSLLLPSFISVQVVCVKTFQMRTGISPSSLNFDIFILLKGLDEEALLLHCKADLKLDSKVYLHGL